MDGKEIFGLVLLGLITVGGFLTVLDMAGPEARKALKEETISKFIRLVERFKATKKSKTNLSRKDKQHERIN